MRLIDVDELIVMEYGDIKFVPKEFIDDAPTVEVIRCKDCKHRDAENCLCEGRGWPMQLVPDDGFCDKGERSEE